MKKLNQIERLILANVLRDRDNNQRLDVVGHRPYWPSEETKQRQADAVEGIVPLRMRDWLGGGSITGGLAVACNRAYARLERLGLIERLALYASTPGRTSHLKLTREGEKIARKLCKGSTSPLTPCCDG